LITAYAAMVSKRKIIVYLATSADDGCIARPEDSVDWLDRPRPKGSYGAHHRTVPLTLTPVRSSRTAWLSCNMPSVSNLPSGSRVRVWIPEETGLLIPRDGA
jgi:hypothetical protein